MAKYISTNEIKAKLLKRWHGFHWHRLFLAEESIGELSVKLPKVTDKQLLHEFPAVKAWLDDLAKLERHQGVSLQRQAFSYHSMGKQVMPVAVCFADIEALARYLGQWQHWQQLIRTFEQVAEALPQLKVWLRTNLKLVDKYHSSWPRLIKVCEYFLANPQPGCYLRQLDIEEVDTKFIEQHKGVIRSLLDEILPAEMINHSITKMSEHGFERRFHLRFDQPTVRFRLLDSQLCHEFHGASDLSLPLEQFANLDLMIDRVFITENKINGLVFPMVNNAIVIFGLGYGIRTLKEVSWLSGCQIYYWGDIDTHGYAMLSQLRGYFPSTRSLLMDEATLTRCRSAWGVEQKTHLAEQLEHLTDAELKVFRGLKENKWQRNLRLEQELIPLSYLEELI